MAKVSGREEVSKFLLRIQDKELSPIIALLTSVRKEILEMRTDCLKIDGSFNRENFRLCLFKVHPNLAAAINKLKKLEKKIAEEMP